MIKLFLFIFLVASLTCFFRDLFRALKRVNRLKNFSNNIELFYEFSDIWIMHLPKAEDRLNVSLIIAEALSISQDQLHFLLKVNKADIQINSDKIIIGRVELPRINSIS